MPASVKVIFPRSTAFSPAAVKSSVLAVALSTAGEPSPAVSEKLNACALKPSPSTFFVTNGLPDASPDGSSVSTSTGSAL